MFLFFYLHLQYVVRMFLIFMHKRLRSQKLVILPYYYHWLCMDQVIACGVVCIAFIDFLFFGAYVVVLVGNFDKVLLRDLHKIITNNALEAFDEILVQFVTS